MNAYCEKAVSTIIFSYTLQIQLLHFLKGVSMQVARFRFDGNPINETDTPMSLEMEEGDTIEVYQQQTGGGLKFTCFKLLKYK